MCGDVASKSPDVAAAYALALHTTRATGGASSEAEHEEAMRRIRAKVLLMPCDEDRYFTLAEAKREAALLGELVEFAPIVSSAGHRAGDPHRAELAAEKEFIRSHVHGLLARP